MYRFIGICVCLAFAQHVLATTNVNQWLWLDTSEDLSKATSNVHQPHFTQMGTPHSIVNISEQLDSYLLDSFYAMVPEGQRVSSDLLENTFNNISVKADFEGEVTVKVAFLNEGAGYKNTLGYFIYPTDTPPQRNALDEIEHVVIFPNASKVRSGGELRQGDQVDLKINLPAGHSIGFFIASDQWGGSYGALKTYFRYSQPFYTLPSLNPEVGLGNKYHVILEDRESSDNSQNESVFFAYGFEDIRTDGGDKDYNDLIFNVEVTPRVAVAGIEDAIEVRSAKAKNITKSSKLAFEDNWPIQGDYDFNDAVIKYSATKQTSNETLRVNGANQSIEIIKRLEIDYEIEAIGAYYRNGFALSLPGIQLSNIKKLTLEKRDNQGKRVAKYTYDNGEFKDNDIAVNGFDTYQYPLALDTDEGRLIITLSENLFEELSNFSAADPVTESMRCMYRTSKDTDIACPNDVTANQLALDIQFYNKSSDSEYWVNADNTLQSSTYDHFLFASEKGNPADDVSIFRFGRHSSNFDWFAAWRQHNNLHSELTGPGRSLEIHLSQFGGTDFFEQYGSFRDPAQFTSQPVEYVVDASLIRPYNVKDTELPWVLELPITWQHPTETTDIANAYPDFIGWLTNPAAYPNWYNRNTRQTYIYQP